MKPLLLARNDRRTQAGAKESDVSTKRRKKGYRRFIQLYMNVKRSPQYHDLSPYARCALIELLDKYTGINNGMIVMGCRELQERMHCAPSTALKALHDLDDAGLAHPMKVGNYVGKKATEWRLTFYLSNKTGDLPVTHWPQRDYCSSGEALKPCSVRVVKRKGADCSSGEAQTPNFSMNEAPDCSSGEAHIDIYQRERAQGSGASSMQQKARRHAGITEPSLNPELHHQKILAKSIRRKEAVKGGGDVGSH
jgi:hypothetical protein